MSNEFIKRLYELSNEELIAIIITEFARHTEVEKSHQAYVGNLLMELKILNEENEVLRASSRGKVKR